MTNMQIAEEYLNKAKNLLSPEGFFSRIFGYKPKPKEAMEMYREAAYHFKVANLWEDAALAYTAAAKIYEKHHIEIFNVARNFSDAANCYRNDSQDNALNAYRQSIDIYIKMGLLDLAAHQLEICSQICENELKDKEKANDFHQKANKLYREHESKESFCLFLFRISEEISEECLKCREVQKIMCA